MRADEWLKAMNIITKQIVRISQPPTARACFWISMHFKSSLSQSPSFLFWRSCLDCVAAAFQREFFHQADSICMQIAPFFNLELRSAIQSARTLVPGATTDWSARRSPALWQRAMNETADRMMMMMITTRHTHCGWVQARRTWSFTALVV